MVMQMRLNWNSSEKTRIALAVLAAALGIGAKLALTGGALLPGIDGAYYWVQVRSVLQDFTLAFDDLPLVFWVQSLFSLCVGNIELGVRLSDALLPALSAIPVYLMLKNAKYPWIPAVGILAVLLHPIQLFFFTGDFIKNEAAIPIIFFIGWTLYNWGNIPKIRSSIYLVGSLSLLAISHFGTLLMGVAIVALWGLFQLRFKPLRFWLIGGLITAFSSAIVLVALAVVVPARFDRLVEFVSQPDVIFTNPAWQMIFYGAESQSIIFPMVAGQLGSLILGVALWRNRKSIPSSKLSLASSSVIVAFGLSSPLIGFEWASRLAALSFAPLLIAAFTVWMVCEKRLAKVAAATLVISTLIVASLLAPMGAKRAGVSDTEYANLTKAASEFTPPANSIIVARHGLEYLVAWTMKTHVLQEESYQDEDLSGYDSIYLLATDGQQAGNAGGKAPNSDKQPANSDKKASVDDKGKSPTNPDNSKVDATGGIVYQKNGVTIVKLR